MTSYSRGYAFERQIKKQLEATGAYVIRSAGSHGIIDLLSFSGNAVDAMQLKKGIMPTQKEIDQMDSLVVPGNFNKWFVLKNKKGEVTWKLASEMKEYIECLKREKGEK
jgi:Holliday junction resolvase